MYRLLDGLLQTKNIKFVLGDIHQLFKTGKHFPFQASIFHYLGYHVFLFIQKLKFTSIQSQRQQQCNE